MDSSHVIGALNKQLAGISENYPESFPNLRSCDTLLVFSDFSGESRDSDFLIFSFLIIPSRTFADWEQSRIEIRSKYLKNSRRMSFKRLGDRQRSAALMPFLNAAESLDGISLSVAVNKRCPELRNTPPIDLSNDDFSDYRKWKPKVLSKACFAIHVLSLLITGLAAPRQNIFWFTDEDAIAANDQRLAELTQLFARICSTYLPFNLGHFRCGTSKSDNGTMQLEDLLAVPDLIAGSLYEQFKLPNPRFVLTGDVFWMYRPDMSPKTKDITLWFSSVSCPLKKILAIIEFGVDNNDQVVSVHHHYNQIGSS
ncbi:MAG: hypothetical protein GY743_24645 [Planctomycetaceae bacterium]|nr:hypothetical protein [Planctomycetaceae bacterium]